MNYIKQKLSNTWSWIKRNTKKTLILVGILGVASAAGIGGIPTGSVEYITAPENNTYKIGVQNFDVALAEDIVSDKALQYKPLMFYL